VSIFLQVIMFFMLVWLCIDSIDGTESERSENRDEKFVPEHDEMYGLERSEEQ